MPVSPQSGIIISDGNESMSVGTISMILAAAWVAVVVVVIAICCASAHADTVSERLLAGPR
jgi:hypothetical protein